MASGSEALIDLGPRLALLPPNLLGVAPKSILVYGLTSNV